MVFDRNEPLGLGFEVLSELFEMTEGYPSFKPFCIKTSRYTESGGNPLDALVFGIGELMEVVHSLGKSPREIFSNLFLEASVGENHFGELVRLKAFRRFVASLSGLYSQSLPEEEKDLLLLCQTSSWSKSLVDAHTNLIRQTYEAMSAVLGGANFLWVRPLDEENTGVLERRIARNVSVILREESHLDKVQDPAAGSFFLEKLTTDMLSHLKERLLQLEAGGGWKENLERGEIHREVRKNREKIQDLVLQNSLPKIGVNRYPAPGPFQKSADFEFFSEKNHELNPTRASYLVELQTQTQP